MLRRQRAQNPAHQRSIQRRRSSFAADIANSKSRSPWTVIEEVVNISTNGASSHKLRRDLSAFELRRTRRHQPKLYLARHLEVAFHSLLLLVNALVETRIRDGDRDLSRKRGG